MTKSIWVIIAIVLVILFFPLPNKSYEIEADDGRVQSKEKYLSALNLAKDTVGDLPNIVLIVADDLGIDDVSLYDTSKVYTRTLSHLARKGTVYTNAYCTSPICAPSRAGMITGRYQNRFGFQRQKQNRYARNIGTLFAMKYLVKSAPWNFDFLFYPPSAEDTKSQGLPSSEITIAEILKNGGSYRTGLFGKWHLGGVQGKLPHDFGFDYHYGFYNSHSLFIPENSEGYVDHRNEQDWTDQYIWKDERKGLSAIVRNDSIINEPKYLSDQITQEAITYMRKHKNERFFTYISYSSPHTPFQVSDKFYNQFAYIEDPTQRIYAAMVANLDLNIGKIYNYLNNSELLSNTLIIITSDNGGAAYTGATDNGNYKGGKTNYFEGGIRVPFVVYHASKHSQKTSDIKVSLLDILPTIAKLTNIPLPEDREIDGLELPMNDDLAYHPEDTTYVPEEIDIPQEFYDRSLYWNAGNSYAIIKGDYKMISTQENMSQRLYNLGVDSFERNDLSETHPKIIDSLWHEIKLWSDGMSEPSWPGVVKVKVQDKGENMYFDL